MKDNYGDTVTVGSYPDHHRNVYVVITPKYATGRWADLLLTPAKARRLAAALNKAADKAESR